MKRRLLPLLLVAAVWPAHAVETPRTVAWESLAGSSFSDDSDVSLRGFLLPVDREGDLVYAFLIVPWAGACIHTAAPPPDQMVLVSPRSPFRMTEIYEMVTVTGRLASGETRQQVLMVDGVRILDSAYAMDGAAVVHLAPSPLSPVVASPWRRILR